MSLAFSDMTRTTRTVIVGTNLTLNLVKVYDVLPVLPEYALPEKKKGRRKKDAVIVVPVVESGSIISIKYNGNYKGTLLEKNKSKAAFKNALTIVIDIEGRKVNFKLSKNGRFQITGNNSDHHIEQCVKHMWDILQKHPDVYELKEDVLRATFWSSMINFQVNLGFRLDRQTLNTYINEHTEYISVFETSSGSASVNIKIPLRFDDLQLRTLACVRGVWSEGVVSYNEFVTKETGKITNRDKRFVSFLVFHTGEVIMTSMDKEVMEPYFKKFIDIIGECKDLII